MLLPHRRELIEFLPLSDLYGEFAGHERLTVFANKGRECVACGRLGTLLLVTRQMSKNGGPASTHIDLYTDDFVLMTVDHITPKKICNQLGWPPKKREALWNKQPMCDPCNNGKGHKLLTIEQVRDNSRRTNKLTKTEGIVKNLVPNIHRLLGDTV